MNILVFDIETVPDVDAGRRMYGLQGLDARDVANVMYSNRLQETDGKSDFLRHHLHQIVAISAVLRRDDKLAVWSLGESDSTEADLVQRFFDGLERFTPQLISWNGGGFDLPVLHYRALLHGVAAPRYWETGDEDTSFRWNNYLNRFHERHTDLMDVLAGYQARAFASLDDIATLIGLPGKLGMDGSAVWSHFVDGDIDAVRNYCETDVLNTYLVFLRYQLIRGLLQESAYQAERERLRAYLLAENKQHFHEFADATQW